MRVILANLNDFIGKNTMNYKIDGKYGLIRSDGAPEYAFWTEPFFLYDQLLECNR